MTDSYLRRAVLSSLAVCALGGDGTSSVILRGGRGLARPMTSTISDCIELLAGNATIPLQNKRLMGELRAMQGQLHHQAYHDALTSLANRTSFIDELEKRLDLCRQEGKQMAVAFVDLDRFRPVNDSLGHDVGNELLIAVGRCLQGVASSTDLVVRFGGDEFVILLNGGDCDAGELEIVYPGILSLRNGETVAIEALLSWTYPEFGPQSPEHVISIAEDSGLALKLHELILAAACAQAAQWQRSQPNPPALSINVSPRQLFDPQFLDMFNNVLANTKPSRTRLHQGTTAQRHGNRRRRVRWVGAKAPAPTDNRLSHKGLRPSFHQWAQQQRR
jgi:predicted signal transduction protein with EAL and GGDEF domain